MAPNGTEWWRDPTAAAYCHLSVNAWRLLRHRGGGPRFFRVGRTRIFYRREDIDAWLSRTPHETNDSRALGSGAKQRTVKQRGGSRTKRVRA